MSYVYTERLDAVRGEFQAARGALTILRDQLSHSRGKRPGVAGFSVGDIELALERVEDTYFLRLTAEAEAICREHLAKHFPAISIGRPYGFSALVNKVARNFDATDLKRRMPPHIAGAVRDLIPHRNKGSHGLPLSEQRPRFNDALSRLSRFVYALP